MDNKSSIFTQEMKKIALILAATVCLSATHAAPKEEKIDTLRTYELQNVEVLSTRAGRKTPVAYTTMDKKQDRKSTRLNSSHANISYAVFCLKKKNKSHLASSL